MASVTSVARTTKQPYGGFIKPSQFTEIQFENEEELFPTENLSPATVGMVVDYMTRYMMGSKLTKAFEISCIGALCAKIFGNDKAVATAKKLLRKIKGLDDESIVCACRIVWFDAYYRVPLWAKEHESQVRNDPNAETISNVRILVNRSLSFWKRYGPIVKDGFTFEPAKELSPTIDGYYGGYTPTVNRGDGDYLSEDTLWDFKVSKKKLTSKATLQILMYWIMGIHSGQPEFQKIKKLGVFNPRLNVAYIMSVDDIPREVVKTVEDNVICYGKVKEERACVLNLAKEFPIEDRKIVKEIYNAGDIVSHGIFGKGKVIKTINYKNNQIVEINFEKVGVKKTMANFAPLTKITEE